MSDFNAGLIVGYIIGALMAGLLVAWASRQIFNGYRKEMKEQITKELGGLIESMHDASRR